MKYTKNAFTTSICTELQMQTNQIQIGIYTATVPCVWDMVHICDNNREGEKTECMY